MELYDYQKIKANTSGALYWAMGTGKTYASLYWLQGNNCKNAVIVCPASVVTQWEQAVSTLNITKNIHIVSYSSVWRDKNKHLFELDNYCCILDECQYINNKSKQTDSCMVLCNNADYILLLSGTPCDGKYEKLYNQLKVLGYEKNKTYFERRYCHIAMEKVPFLPYPLKVVKWYKNIPELKEVMTQLNINIKTLNSVALPTTQTVRSYHRVKSTATDYHSLRQEGSIIGCTDKVEYIKTLINSTNDRIVIFYNYNQELDTLRAIIDKPISEVNGHKHDLTAYNDLSNSTTLVQYKAGSAGLNLQKAHYTIFASPPVSSIDYEQAKARTHRIGQNKKCIYYTPITYGIEERIYSALAQKKDYSEQLFKQDVTKGVINIR